MSGTTGLMHWVVLTNINHGFEDKWLVLDSLNSETYLRTLRPAIIRICASLSNTKNRLEVCTVNVQKQNGISDCGLFALAYVVELCQGNNPAAMTFDQSSMRIHYDSCIANKQFKSFQNMQNIVELNYKVHKFNKSIKE